MALLRGINVGGKRRVDMKQLKAVFEDVGMSSVKTYINSGNVIFSSSDRGKARLIALLEKAIAKKFGFAVDVLLCDLKGMRAIVEAIPGHWTNNDKMKVDVLFLKSAVNRSSVLKKMRHRPEIEDVKYVPGAVIWRIDRKDATRSGLMRVAGTDIYKSMSIRNCNTTRKLLELMEAAQAG